MFCRYCGAEISENAKFCVSCGSPVEAQPVQATYVGDDGLVQPAPKMKWFKFVINFSLWAGAILNFLNGIMTMTGMQYEAAEIGPAEEVYELFDGLKTVDVLYGALMIVLAVYMIITRFRLAGYYKNGPAMFISTYAIALVINIVYMFSAMSVLDAGINDISTSDLWVNMVMQLVMIVLNIIYFKKRKHLFTR